MNKKPDTPHLLKVGKANFEPEVLRSNRPVLVAFLTPWSRACSVLTFVLDKVIMACGGSVKFVTINADDEPDLSLWYGIRSVPTLLYFVDGVIRAKIVGTASKEAILAKLEPSTWNSEVSKFPKPTKEQ
jgi:thioredoxin 1